VPGSTRTLSSASRTGTAHLAAKIFGNRLGRSRGRCATIKTAAFKVAGRAELARKCVPSAAMQPSAIDGYGDHEKCVIAIATIELPRTTSATAASSTNVWPSREKAADISVLVEFFYNQAKDHAGDGRAHSGEVRALVCRMSCRIPHLFRPSAAHRVADVAPWAPLPAMRNACYCGRTTRGVLACEHGRSAALRVPASQSELLD
jgi:hypothetical protein